MANNNPNYYDPYKNPYSNYKYYTVDGPIYTSGPYREPIPSPPIKEQPVPENPCLNIYDYGHVLWDNHFQWADEVAAYISSNSVKKIAAFNDVALEWLAKQRSLEIANDINITTDVITRNTYGQYIVKCTGKYLKDFLCKVKQVNYYNLVSAGVAIAKFQFNDNSLPNEYFISSDGKICYLEKIINKDIPTDIGYPTIPSPQPLPPDNKPNLGSGLVYAQLSDEDKVFCNDINTGPLWSNNQKYLATPSISTINNITGSANYHLDVYNEIPGTTECSEIQYCIVYADYDGKGDKDLGGFDNETLSKAMYSQYSHILLPHGQEKFKIDGNDEDYVYIIDVKRDRYKQSMDPGNWQLTISSCSFSNDISNSNINNMVTSPYVNEGFTFIDDSRLKKEPVNFTNKVYNIVRGTIEDGVGTLPQGGLTVDTGSYGLFYPNHGIIVLAGSKLDNRLGFKTNRNIEKNGYNTYRLHHAIKKVTDQSLTDASGDPLAFWGRWLKMTYNSMYFVRVKNTLFNFTNNPTFTSGSEGVIIDTLQNQERAYFTSIGLYNNAKELLAIAKIPKAKISSCTKETMYKVKIGF